MEEFCVEVDMNIWYLDEKSGTNLIFKLDFYTLSKTQKKLKLYLESYNHVDFKNGITIEFSCRNNGEIGWWSGHKKPKFIWKGKK